MSGKGLHPFSHRVIPRSVPTHFTRLATKCVHSLLVRPHSSRWLPVWCLLSYLVLLLICEDGGSFVLGVRREHGLAEHKYCTCFRERSIRSLGASGPVPLWHCPEITALARAICNVAVHFCCVPGAASGSMRNGVEGLIVIGRAAFSTVKVACIGAIIVGLH